MNSGDLLVATAIGTAIQLAMVVAGHFVPFIRNRVFAAGGVAISLAVGLIYAMMAGGGWGAAIAGGTIAGGVSALIGIVVSFALGDVAAAVIGFGTIASAAAGALGGALGRLFGGG